MYYLLKQSANGRQGLIDTFTDFNEAMAARLRMEQKYPESLFVVVEGNIFTCETTPIDVNACIQIVGNGQALITYDDGKTISISGIDKDFLQSWEGGIPDRMRIRCDMV